jgi:hypothetical protein
VRLRAVLRVRLRAVLRVRRRVVLCAALRVGEEKPYGSVSAATYAWNRKAALGASVPIKEEKQAFRAGP